MPAEALRCPTCGGADSSRADANGIHACVYCGVRYRITAGAPTQIGAVGATRPGAKPAVVGAAIAIVLIAAGAGFFLSVSRSPQHPDVPKIDIPPIAATPESPATPPVVVEPVVVDAPPDVPVHATFEPQHRRSGGATNFYVYGWVSHDAPYTIDKPKINAVLLDTGGKELRTDFGYAEDVVAPGERVPAMVLVMDPPKHDRIEYEVVARKATYIPPKVEGLRLEHGDVTPDQFSGYRVQGKVFNDGTSPARFVKVTVLGLDDAGKLLGFDYTFADTEVLDPGKSARFDVRIQDFEAKPAKYELFVEGSRP
jgi:hypothetical protein